LISITYTAGTRRSNAAQCEWAKSPKKQSEGVRFFVGTQKTVPCQKYTDCFFDDIAHWAFFERCYDVKAVK